MTKGSHGNGAFWHYGKCNCCINPNYYKTPPSQYENLVEKALKNERIKIRIYVYPSSENPYYKYYGEPIIVIVDSGATTSVFYEETAKSLDIDDEILRNGKGSIITLFNELSQPCLKYKIPINLGNRYQEISVLWPIDIPSKKLMKRSPKKEDILGMEDVLSQNMLCLTPEKLYIFPVKSD